MKKCFALLAAAALLLSACTPINTVTDEAEKNGKEAAAAEKEPMNAQACINAMSLDEKIYQLMVVTPEALTGLSCVTEAKDEMKLALKEKPVGGIICFAANLEDDAQVKKMLSDAQGFSKIPLFIGVDEEGGAVSRAGKNPDISVTYQPSAKEIAAEGADKAYEVGLTLGRELSDLGFNVDFAPVADVITNPDNTEIGSRSFGKEPDKVAEAVAAEVKGLSDGGVHSVLKHFPGHGSTSFNSHNGKSESGRTVEELRENEFIPFKAGINAGAEFVMVSHMTLVTLGEDVPSSLSYKVITELLKEELAFSGIVITDSLSMGAVTEEYSSGEAAVAALSAGADMLLMPENIDEAFAAVKKAVEDGALSEAQIDERVLKILSIKGFN